MDIDKLIEELEGAEEGSRERDIVIEKTTGQAPNWPDHEWVGSCPHYTTSVDAALGLVPEQRYIEMWKNGGDCWCLLERNGGPSEGATFPLAICIAALKARKAKE